MKKHILKAVATLLHHANRKPSVFFSSKKFYAEKERILKKYGTLLGHELQHIQGKRCYECNGSGKEYCSYLEDYDTCSNCHGGWYKLPFVSVLEKYEFMGFSFHIPKEKIYSSLDDDILKKYNVIGEVSGYITHKEPDIRLAKLFYLLFLPNVFFESIWNSVKMYLRRKRFDFVNYFKPIFKVFDKSKPIIDEDLPF